MGNFSRGGSRGGFGGGKRFESKGGSFNRGGSRGGFGGRDSDRPHEMHKAVCASCGQDCEVPFKPNGIKPVYCSDCFKSEGGESRENSRDSFRERRPEREFGRDREEKEMFKTVCDDCGDECEVPFRPTPGKTVLCSDCFNKDGKKTNRVPAGVDYKVQFDLLNAKLDKILRGLNLSDKVLETPKAPVEVKEPKKEAKKEVVKEVEAEIKIEEPKKVEKKKAEKVVKKAEKVEKKADKKKATKKK